MGASTARFGTPVSITSVRGAPPPAIVTDATREYLDAEDLISIWIEDRCHEEANARTLSSDLYRSFKEWAEASGERAMSQRGFSMALEGHGYTKEKEKTREGRYFLGLRL